MKISSQIKFLFAFTALMFSAPVFADGPEVLWNIQISKSKELHPKCLSMMKGFEVVFKTAARHVINDFDIKRAKKNKPLTEQIVVTDALYSACHLNADHKQVESLGEVELELKWKEFAVGSWQQCKQGLLVMIHEGNELEGNELEMKTTGINEAQCTPLGRL